MCTQSRRGGIPRFAALASLATALVTIASCSSAPWSDQESLLRELQTLETVQPQDAVKRLSDILRHGTPWFRARAARALGRVAAPAVTTPLCAAIGDPDEEVRTEVAFALGQLEGPEARVQALGALLPMLRSPSPAFRARLVEAIGKLGWREHAEQVLDLLADADAGTRASAALALHRLRSHEPPDGSEVGEQRQIIDAEILAALMQAHETEPDASVRWHILYALIGFHEPRALSVYLRSIEADDVWERFFATRGIGELARTRALKPEDSDTACKALLRRLDDKDRRVAIEAALALGDPSPSGRDTAPRDTPPPFDERRVLDALAERTQSKDPGLVEACIRGIGHFQSIETKANSAINFAIASPKVRTRATAIQANARLLGDGFAGILHVYAKEEDWRIRAAVARATRFLSKDIAFDLVGKLAEDPETRVRLAALETLAQRRGDVRIVDLVKSTLSQKDAALREEAATTLERLGDPKAVVALREALVTSRDPDYADARVAMIQAIAKLAPEDATASDFIEASLADPVNRVRRAAWAALSKRRPVRPLSTLQLADEGREVALPGRDYPIDFLRARPRVLLETTKGRITLELDPDAAPNHVFNLLHFVRKGAYDGRLFHRVVPNFVVQGGDMRGDGYGNATWWGGRLRREISARRFDAFALGMPRGSDADSGGDQIFITLVPTPHLDGAYTCFGRVVEGFEVVSDIEVGDRIERARQL